MTFYYQFSLFENYPKPRESIIKLISKLIGCENDLPLLEALGTAIENFIKLPTDKSYSINFSGGKDSHVLLGIYLLYLQLGYPKLDIDVCFADTKIEYHSMYQVIDRAKTWCETHEINFVTVIGNKSYWYVQYAYGYPVPNHFARWCTGRLKVQPLNKHKRIPLTERHLGESSARDNRIKKQQSSCGTNECGTDKLKAIEPIIHFRNCLIWDCLFYFDGTLLYEGCFDLLKQTYKQAGDTKSGSLRMGCFMCPVIALSTIQKNYQSGLIDSGAINIRMHLEELRQARRIKNQRTKKNGSIYVVDRRTNWETLDKQYLLDNNWITQQDIAAIDKSLKSNYSYPPTYKREWIDEQHKLIK